VFGEFEVEGPGSAWAKGLRWLVNGGRRERRTGSVDRSK